MTHHRHRHYVLPLYFISGACGLIYQITWTRMLTLVFGITVYAVAAVLGSFMTGLAAGSFAFGRVASRIRRPLAAYGWIEIGIGGFALLFPLVLNAAAPLFVSMYRRFGGEGEAVLALLRLAVIFPLLLAPTFMMGATFPLICRHLVPEDGSEGRETGVLYAVNTAGAVTGALLAGFVLLDRLGMRETILLAAMLNITVGVVSLLLDRNGGTAPYGGSKSASAPSPPQTAPGGQVSAASVNGPGRPLILTVLAFSGFAALALEVLWTRVLVFHTHNSTYAFSSMLIAFLSGIAAGGWFAGVITIRMAAWRGVLLAACQTAIGIWTIGSLWLLGRLPALSEFVADMTPTDNWLETVLVILVQVNCILFVPAFLMGMTFPLGVSLAASPGGGIARTAGDLYAANSAGTVLGSLFAGFVFIPLAGVRNSFMLIAAINLALGSMLFLKSGRLGGRLRIALTAAGPILLLAAQLRVPKDAVRNDFERILGRVVHYHEGVTDTVMVIDLYADQENRRNAGPENRMLVFSDGRGTAGHNTVVENRYYAHLPMLLHENPEDVLVICVGAGNTLGAFAAHDRMKRLDAVEISDGVVDASRYFSLTNGGVLQSGDERIRLHIEDGRIYLAGTERTYDVIHLEPPELHTAGVVFLYTREFHELARARLKPGGIYSHWFNASKLSEDEMRMIVATFLEVFPRGTIWQGPAGYSWNMLARNDGEITIPIDHALEVFRSNNRLRHNMTDNGPGDPFDVFATYMMGPESAAVFATGAPVLTDNRTRIDFSNARSPYAGFGVVNIFMSFDGRTVIGKRRREHQGRSDGTAAAGGWGTIIRLGLASDDPWTILSPGGSERADTERALAAARARRIERLEGISRRFDSETDQ